MSFSTSTTPSAAVLFAWTIVFTTISCLVEAQGWWDGGGGGGGWGFDLPPPPHHRHRHHGPPPPLGFGPPDGPPPPFGSNGPGGWRPPSDIPPHVFRRIARFCWKHPEHPKCKELRQGSGDLPPPPPPPPPPPFWGGGRLPPDAGDDRFPEFTPFRLPPIPILQLPDILANVPPFLRSVLGPRILGNIDNMARDAMRSSCSSGRCREQKTEVSDRRAIMAEHESRVQRLFDQKRSQNDIDNHVEVQMSRTHQVKKALLKKAGLEADIEPLNDGIFQSDLFLTENQANSILNEITANNGGQTPPAPGNGRRKRSALFLETMPTQRWPNDRPIQYMFDQTLSEVERAAVISGIREIESKTCVRFREERTKPSNSHIYYVKVASSTFCGVSYIGRVEPVNTIYLTFACGNPTGIAIHETLHALGLNHEQLRGDRDKYITINWKNVNPQNYDFFAIADSKLYTSYGVEYDYSSIMHYDQFIAGKPDSNLPTMTAKINPTVNNVKMGQRNGLSTRDIEIITKMYCVPNCDDNNVYCGAWALQNLCTASNNAGWMVQNCKKSCNIC